MEPEGAMKLDRKNLPASDFAIPERRAYPIPDKLHARLALDDVKRDPKARERARVRLAVAQRFPELAQEATLDHMHEMVEGREEEQRRRDRNRRSRARHDRKDDRATQTPKR